MENFDESQTIPLFLKYYKKGKLTNSLLASTKTQKPITLTQPLSYGLRLQTFPEGKIIVLSGGTDFHPFYDVIDLLYKEYYVS